MGRNQTVLAWHCRAAWVREYTQWDTPVAGAVLVSGISCPHPTLAIKTILTTPGKEGEVERAAGYREVTLGPAALR